MTRAFENSGGHFYFRRPSDGKVVADTTRPMPAFIGTVTFNAVAVSYPRTPGEVQRAEFFGGGSSIRFWTETPAYSALVSTIDLGPFDGSTDPTIFLAKVKIRRTTQGGNVTGVLEAPLAVNETLQWPGGSLLLEHFGQASKIWMWRHLDFGVEAGRWVLRMWQGNDAYTTDKSTVIVRSSTASVFEIDLIINWGVFR